MHASRSTYNLHAAICFRTAQNSQNAIRDFSYIWVGYKLGQLLHIMPHMHTEIQDGGHECLWFYETLEQTYKAI